MVNGRARAEGLNSWHGAPHSFPCPAQCSCLPGMPSARHRWSGRRLARMAALSWLWPLLSCCGWHSGDARAARDARTATGIILFSLKKIRLRFDQLTKGEIRDPLAHKWPSTQSIYAYQPDTKSTGRRRAWSESGGGSIGLPSGLSISDTLSHKTNVLRGNVLSVALPSSPK
jgi:hypothetical protein